MEKRNVIDKDVTPDFCKQASKDIEEKDIQKLFRDTKDTKPKTKEVSH